MPPTNLTLATRIKASDKTLFRKLDGETVLLSLSQGAYFGLDEVGTRIWELIAERAVLSAVLAGVLEEFEVEEGQASADLLSLVGQMLERELVVIEPG